jgi:amino acid adenylation domain-containing protein
MNLITAFNKQCQLTPEKLALKEDNNQLSYRQFQQAVNQFAFFLQQQNCNEKPIALLLERGINATIAIYAILTVGASYLPLDIKNPIDRLNTIIDDAKPQLIIGQGERPNGLHQSQNWLDFAQFKKTNSLPKRVIIEKESIAAILYTSGSTGSPKGIALSHRAMTNFVSWMVQTFRLNNNDRIASLAPFHFDLSVFDLFATLATGATIYFVPTKLTLSPSRLTAWLAEMKITTFYTVPSLLSFIVLKGNLVNTDLKLLRQILFAGEVFPYQPLIKLADLLPEVDFYNLYGPTETNVCCYWKVDRQRLTNQQSIPIGTPACGSQLSISKKGELWVKSDNNFSGYWQQGKLISRNPNEFYATGDKVSYNPYKEYCYYGRLDRMLKCSGYRIEPAEIEAIINRVEGIIVCVVIGISDSSRGQRPAAVLILNMDANLTTVIKQIRQQLPTYMQPVKFKILDNLPKLSSGKTDYLALSQLF